MGLHTCLPRMCMASNEVRAEPFPSLRIADLIILATQNQLNHVGGELADEFNIDRTSIGKRKIDAGTYPFIQLHHLVTMKSHILRCTDSNHYIIQEQVSLNFGILPPQPSV